MLRTAARFVAGSEGHSAEAVPRGQTAAHADAAGLSGCRHVAVAVDLTGWCPVAVNLARWCPVAVTFRHAIAVALLAEPAAVPRVTHGAIAVPSWLTRPPAAVASGLLRSTSLTPGVGGAIGVAPAVLGAVTVATGLLRSVAVTAPVRAHPVVLTPATLTAALWPLPAARRQGRAVVDIRACGLHHGIQFRTIFLRERGAREFLLQQSLDAGQHLLVVVAHQRDRLPRRACARPVRPMRCT